MLKYIYKSFKCKCIMSDGLQEETQLQQETLDEVSWEVLSGSEESEFQSSGEESSSEDERDEVPARRHRKLGSLP